MLTAITFENFRSYRLDELPLSSLTVLIGANASGKSNAIDGLRLLSWLAQGQRLSSIQQNITQSNRALRGRIEDLGFERADTFVLGCLGSGAKWKKLRVAIESRTDGLHVVEERLELPRAQVPLYELHEASRGQHTDVWVAYNNFATGGKKPQIRCSDQSAIFTQLTSPTSFSFKHVESRKTIPQACLDVARWLSQMLFLDPQPVAMRDYSFPGEKQIYNDGSNLSAVLYELWGNGPQTKSDQTLGRRAAILAFIQSLPEQNIVDVSFLQEPRGGVMVQLQESFGGQNRWVDASLLSDGTLRVLAIAAALLSAHEGSLVVIEEIDNGVHPSRAQHLLAQIREIAQRRKLRVLLSTHNPALLDALPDSAIPDVVFCFRDPKHGASSLLRLADFEDYPELVAQGTLGHLVTSGLLERMVKNQRTDDERKAQALAWLKKLHARDGGGESGAGGHQ